MAGGVEVNQFTLALKPDCHDTTDGEPSRIGVEKMRFANKETSLFLSRQNKSDGPEVWNIVYKPSILDTGLFIIPLFLALFLVVHESVLIDILVFL